jgi:hypothetical protein
MKINWLVNVGPVLIVWMVFMLGHASTSTITIACVATYYLMVLLDLVACVLGIPNPYGPVSRCHTCGRSPIH